MEYTDIELKNEKWKDIFGYEGVYQVSDLGRVRSRYSGEWRILKWKKQNVGYLQVDLYKDKKRKQHLVHRLVADAFIPNNDESKNQVNHINEDKTDNRASNLEWCDRQYNMTYNDIHHKRNTKRRKLKNIYDPNLTYDQNIELFNEQGIKCSWLTIWNIRKDLGLVNQRQRPLERV